MKLTVAKKERRIYRVLLILMIFSLLVTGCGQNADTNPDNDSGETDTSVGAVLESGFKKSDAECETPLFHCAYRSDKTEFDIDDVTLDFYYGGWFSNLGIDYDLRQHNFPTFEIYFTNDANDKCFVKRVEENLVSEKYRCKFIYDDNRNATEIIFNHSESITVPREIFTENEGVIFFTIYSQNVNYTNSSVEFITGKAIFYKVIEGKVILSSQEF